MKVKVNDLRSMGRKLHFKSNQAKKQCLFDTAKVSMKESQEKTLSMEKCKLQK